MDDENTPKRNWPWGFSYRRRLILIASLAAVGVLVVWWGVLFLVALGGAAGAFLGALICPHVGFDVVLDDLRYDIAKCLAVGGYLVGGAWGMVAGLRWLVTQAWGTEAPVFVSGGLILFFVFTTGLVVRFLWSDIDNVEAVIITGSSLIAVFVVVSLCAGG